jgi:GT2 family glycosyltransferase
MLSIIIPVHIIDEMLFNYTESCIEAIKKNTINKYEIILVDNGSSEKYLPALNSLEQTTNGACINIVRLDQNKGFAAGINAGLKQSDPSADYIVLLNNDILVPPKWDEIFLSHKGHGDLIACMSNVASGQQEVTGGYWGNFDKWAIDFNRRHVGEYIESERLAFFCILIKREVFDKTGFLDEIFNLGSFEDDDYSIRAKKEGFKLIVAKDLFVHHYGHRTMQCMGLDWRVLQKKNQKLLVKKWGNQLKNTVWQPLIENELELLCLNLLTKDIPLKEYMPIIKQYLDDIDDAVVFGVKNGESTIIMLSSNIKKLTTYGSKRFKLAHSLKELATETDFNYIRQNTLEANINEVDLLFLDSYRSYDWIKSELAKHADKAKKYIFIHGTKLFDKIGEDGRRPGITAAIDEFINTKDSWAIEKKYDAANGLTILKRVIN